MKKLIIFGCGPFAKLLRIMIEEDGQGPVTAFCVNESYLCAEDNDGSDIPVVAFEKLDELYGKGNFEVLITVGYRNMNESRAQIFSACDEYGYSIASFYHSTAHICCESIGRGNIILGNCYVHHFTTVGEGNILFNDTVIGHDVTLKDFCFFAGGAITGGMVEIDSYCFFGIRSILCDHVRVAEHNFVGAGTVVSRSTKPYSATIPTKSKSIAVSAEGLSLLLG